ncbi:type II toxin-antitoxin system HipA family toxin [Prescottella equi]|uniref:type II toxin-antitoxin system HipA family toxin n=1 Tax=Rhodococcus hoagii TaxID=43767 RepID=UPI0009BDE0B3|nr:type II toxin-antitoxin system HipA family toxin [Prescottella equi]WQB73144.1 type II toxin-antitoxin system HipA family toxin [Prescottella equi]
MTPERRHAVLLNGTQIGYICHRGDVCRLILSENYWNDPSRSVLGLWFDDNPGQSPKAALRLPTWFSNLLPEGRLREWIAVDRGVSVAREIELLLQVGGDLPGAVQIIEDGAESWDSAAVSVLDDVEEVRKSEEAMAWKFSLAGVGMKFSMLQDGERLTLPARNEIGNWIVKLPDSNHPRVPLNEFSMMTIAKEVGVEVPNFRLVDRSELPNIPRYAWPRDECEAYAIERFDRTPGGGRVHIEDLAQVRGFYPERKYEGAFETVAALIYRNRDTGSLQEFARRLALNLLIGNGDAHLKNWSLIYRDGRNATISPAYDIVSTAPYMTSAAQEDLGLKFNRSRRFESVTWRSFQRLENLLGASDANLLSIVDDTVNRFISVWPEVANALGEDGLIVPWITENLAATAGRLRC